MSPRLHEPDRATAAPCRALRADAERNRARLVEAARAVFAESGLDAPLEDIAERANVGIATLYRRFPTREELIAATYEAQLAVFAQTVEDALHVPDPWAGFSGCIEQLCAMQAENRGFTTLVTIALPDSTEATALRERAKSGLAALVQRAQEAGVLREDFVAEDVALILMANAGVLRATRDGAPHAWRRLVAYLLEVFRVDGGEPEPLPAAPTSMQMHRAMMACRTAQPHCPAG
ncbi:TetR/AcrR family transcriptional regulator [Streptacidiphilus sp. 4-A2]|nr:TetR/AcrR family transcriptional regulator [Streptacidiphilus sp. 4-A2]